MSAFEKLKSILKDTKLWEHLTSRRKRKISFSQFGEDVHIASLYEGLALHRNIHVRAAVIVDVGSFRPIYFSNSYLFTKMGWRGINIDPTPIGPNRGKATFYLFGSPSVWNTMDEQAARSASDILGVKPREISIDVRGLEEILSEHLKSSEEFEILSIDAEGYDLEILKTNNFLRHRPRVILVEVHEIALEGLGQHPIVIFMKDHGYHLHSWINPNLMFVRDDSALF
jgi:hypothetical protein